MNNDRNIKENDGGSIGSTLREMRTFLLLWLTQSFSGLGSAMTSYALVIWSYTQEGSALMTALLMVSSYTPYVLLSIFAGALSDKWNKKLTMLVCDTLAAATTVAMLILLLNGRLRIWHLYLINGLNGLMNTVQQPASEVAVTKLLPKKYYQQVGGLRYLSSALNSIMTPIIATAVLGIAGMGAVVAFDLCTFGIAFLTLAFWIRIPQDAEAAQEQEKEKLWASAKKGLAYLREQKGILGLILFLAAINLVASVYNALPGRRKRESDGAGERCHRYGDPGRIGLRLCCESAKEPGAGHLQLSAALYELREFLPGAGQDACRLVHRRVPGVDRHTPYERQSGCPYAAACAGADAGKGVFREKFPAVFYDSHRIFPGRVPGGSGVRTHYGGPESRERADAALWQRERLRGGVPLLRDCLCRDRSVSVFPKKQAYLGAGEGRVRSQAASFQAVGSLKISALGG